MSGSGIFAKQAKPANAIDQRAMATAANAYHGTSCTRATCCCHERRRSGAMRSGGLRAGFGRALARASETDTRTPMGIGLDWVGSDMRVSPRDEKGKGAS